MNIRTVLLFSGSVGFFFYTQLSTSQNQNNRATRTSTSQSFGFFQSSAYMSFSFRKLKQALESSHTTIVAA
jgi:hypothetical protein